MYSVGAVERDLKRLYVHPRFERTVFRYSLDQRLTKDFLRPAMKRLIRAKKGDKTATLPDFRADDAAWFGLCVFLPVMTDWRF